MEQFLTPKNLLQAKGPAFVDTYETLRRQRFEVEFKIEGMLVHKTRANLAEQRFYLSKEFFFYGNIIAM